jgi:hypothetical protein
MTILSVLQGVSPLLGLNWIGERIFWGLWDLDIHDPRDVDVLNRIIGDRYILWRARSYYSRAFYNPSDHNSETEMYLGERTGLSVL